MWRVGRPRRLRRGAGALPGRAGLRGAEAAAAGGAPLPGGGVWRVFSGGEGEPNLDSIGMCFCLVSVCFFLLGVGETWNLVLCFGLMFLFVCWLRVWVIDSRAVDGLFSILGDRQVWIMVSILCVCFCFASVRSWG